MSDQTPQASVREKLEPRQINEGFLRGVVGCTTSYSEGWRDVCARLLWVEQQLAALPAQPEPQGWQPILTMPKDGERRLAWCPDTRLCHVVWRGTLEWGWNGAANLRDEDAARHFTHWMPLPSPPKVTP